MEMGWHHVNGGKECHVNGKEEEEQKAPEEEEEHKTRLSYLIQPRVIALFLLCF